MADYHVGCGAFGIYAGTLNPMRKDGTQLWREKSEVTDECVAAVVQYYKMQLDYEEHNHYHAQFKLKDGTVVHLDIRKEDDAYAELIGGIEI